MKFKITMIMVITGFALGGFSSAFGSSGWDTNFNSQNGTSYGCTLCHTSAPALNRFGTDWLNPSLGNKSYVVTAALASLDSDGDGFSNGVEIQSNTNPGNANSRPASGGDTTLPVVSTNLSIPATSNSLTVPVTAFTATDNVGVTGYLLNESAVKPAAGNWPTAAPGSYTFGSAGAKTLYAWARDAAGNVSNSVNRSVTITLPPTADTTLPVVSGFTLSGAAGSLTVSITTFSATDNVGVTGYLVNESATKPVAGNWPTAAPSSYTFTTAGTKTLYAWARDAAGNVSDGLSQNVTVTSGGGGVDLVSPEVMEFTLPLTSTSLTVPILAFRAIDDVAPSAYLVTTTPAAPSVNATGWKATPPTSYTFTSGGAKILYGWVKDAAGNVSESVWDNVDISTPAGDQTPPVVTLFSIPVRSSSLTVPINRFRATDNVSVTGYLLTTSSTKPSRSASNWRSSPPTSYTFSSSGTKRLYPWAKDAAGNISAPFAGATVTISTGGGGDD
jgi:hypothetical protein